MDSTKGSRAVLVGVLLLVLGIQVSEGHSASSTTPAARLNGELGANFNGEYQDINYEDLNRAGVHWIRGFITMTRVNAASVSTDPAITGSLAAMAHGFHAILTLKWDFRQTGIPKAGTQRYKEAAKTLNAVLAQVMGKVDILEIGNEPYWETRPEERNHQINQFYDAMANDVILFRRRHCKTASCTVLFMGALNRLNAPAMRRAPWVKRWLAFVKGTPEIRGVDIHPHVESLGESTEFVKYVLQGIRPTQQFLATEFSLIWCWKSHMHDRVPEVFARRYGMPKSTQMWQAINAAINQPFSQEQWNALLMNSPWFAARKTYIQKEMQLFRDTSRLAVACYGFEQGASMTRNFKSKAVPWLLNSVYARRTVRVLPGAAPPTNPYWLRSVMYVNGAGSKE